jgi:adenylate cyclase
MESSEATADGSSSLSIRQLAERTGAAVEFVQELAQHRIVRSEHPGRFSRLDINRVRLAQALVKEGLSLDEMARALSEGALSFDWLDGVFPEPVSLSGRRAEDVARDLGLTTEALRSLYAAWGLAPPLPGEPIREDDAHALLAQRAFMEQGMNADALIAATRNIGEHLRRVSETQIGFFRYNVIDMLVSAGISPARVLDAVATVSAALQPSGLALIQWLHRRHFENQVMQTAVLLLEGGLEQAGYLPESKTSPPAIAFLDLSGFTRLTEDSGDESAARLAASLKQMVSEAAVHHGGRVVKLLGDGVMFHFTDAGAAALCGLAMIRRAAELRLPPARVGVQAGPVVFRDGDYFGRTVNVAARITDYARPREVLLGAGAAASPPPAGVVYREIGTVLLKGLQEPVTLYRAGPLEVPSRTGSRADGPPESLAHAGVEAR